MESEKRIRERIKVIAEGIIEIVVPSEIYEFEIKLLVEILMELAKKEEGEVSLLFGLMEASLPDRASKHTSKYSIPKLPEN
ncbi:MAG: hypothetical protein ACJATA_000408 [Sphingobacteriales bacterium]|jgi:hypothetical protein